MTTPEQLTDTGDLDTTEAGAPVETVPGNADAGADLSGISGNGPIRTAAELAD